MPSLGIAIVGLHMGYSHFQAIQDNPNLRLVGLCDIDNETLDRIAAEWEVSLATINYEDILSADEVDIVSIATPDPFHEPQTIAALEAGKHVLVEKPMARTVEECENMVAAARKADRKLMVGQVCRFYTFFEQAKQWAEDGTLGEIYFVETTYIHNYEQIPGTGGWRFDPEKRHPLIGAGCHAIDLARWMGGDAEEVSAYGNHFNLPQQQWEDHIIINVKFQAGAVGRIMVSTGCQRPYNIDLELWGTQGTLAGDNTSPEAKLCLRAVDRHTWMQLPKPSMVKAIAAEIAHFVDCILQDRTPLIDGVDGAKTVATAWAAIKSMRTGRPVKVRNDF